MNSKIEILNEFKSYTTKVFGLKESTVEQYVSCVKGFFEWLEKNGINYEDVKMKDIINFYLYLNEKQFTTSTMIVYASAIKAFYDYLLYTDQLDYNPTVGVRRRGRVEKRLPVYLTKEEVAKLINLPYIVRLNEVNARFDSACMRFILATGLRVSEFCKLKRDDILDDNRVRVYGKGGKERIVPIVRKWFEVDVDGIFIRKRNPWSIWSRISHYRPYFVKKLTPHVLRHTFATMLAQEGVDILTLKEILGHENVQTTAIYIHLAGIDIERALRRAGVV